jgi:hypothetical protein
MPALIPPKIRAEIRHLRMLVRAYVGKMLVPDLLRVYAIRPARNNAGNYLAYLNA